MTKEERGRRYLAQHAEHKAKSELLDQIAETVSSASGELEEICAADFANEQPPVPAVHRRKARSVKTMLGQWVDRLERESEVAYQRREDVGYQLCDLVADHPCLAASLGIDLLQEYTKGGRRFQIRLSADPEDVYTVEILDFVPKPEVNDDYRNPNRRGPGAHVGAAGRHH